MRRRTSIEPDEPLGEPDVRPDGSGWFVADYLGERIGRFDSRDRAEKMWRRWARSYKSGVMLPANSFNVVPRAARKDP